MKRTRIATAVLVTRGPREDPEVLVVRRSPALRFFGGYWAFPGGVVDPCDHDGDPDHDDAHRRCALRELVEEVGLPPVGCEAALEEREGLLERGNDGAGARVRALLDGAPGALDAARPFARLTTPPFAPVLYRTRFLHVEAAASFEPTIVEGELVDGEFLTPAALLDAWRRGERLVAPPVLYMVEQLLELGLPRFLEEMAARSAELEAGRLHPIRNVPGILMAPLRTRTLPPATTTNAYLVGERRLFVVDPAPTDPAEQRRLFDLVDERCAGGAELVGVLVTHHHPDHVGAVEATARRYDVPVLAHAETLARLDLDVENTRALADGVELPLGAAPDGAPGWVLTAHHTPGHAPGHLTFRESRYGALLAGDLVSTVSTIVIDPPDGHLATYLDSLRRTLAQVEPGGVLHPAHGPVASDGARLLRRYLEHRERREESLLRALGEETSAEEELLPRVYADVDPELHPVAARSLRAGLEKLAEEGRAEEVAARAWRRSLGG